MAAVTGAQELVKWTVVCAEFDCFEGRDGIGDIDKADVGAFSDPGVGALEAPDIFRDAGNPAGSFTVRGP